MSKNKSTPRASHNHFAGYHAFKGEDGEAFGSFEVFYVDRDLRRLMNEAARARNEEANARCGWHWHACLPGCMPDGEACGPYTSSRAAWRAAREEA